VLSAIALAFPPVSRAAQTPPSIGGGYTDVIAIPVKDPAIRAISGALFMPLAAAMTPWRR
jgi:hypothetical protein